MVEPPLEIRCARRDELPAIAAHVAALNAAPQTRCLHLGEEPASILTEMTAYTESPVMLVAARDGRLTGLLGCDYLEETGRAWMWGPYVLDGDWGRTADALLACLLDKPPGRLLQMDSFQDHRNQRGHEFFLRHGFADRGAVHVYVADRPAALAPSPDEPCPVLDPSLAASLAELHEREFPRTCRGVDLLEQRETAASRLLVTRDGGRLTGYIHVRRDDDGRNGFVHFLAVDPAHRHRGLGRRLLSAGMSWLFDQLQVPRIGLTVEDGRTDARSLYESAGFRLEATGRNARWLAPAVDPFGAAPRE